MALAQTHLTAIFQSVPWISEH